MWRTIVWFLSYVTALFAHTVILVSENDFREKKMPFIKRKCVVVHTAVPEIQFLSRTDARDTLFSKEEQDIHAHDLWVITIAELTQNKNIRSALSAVKAHNLKEGTKVFYTIFGEGELKEELIAYVKEEKLERYVLFKGYVPEGRTLLKAFDVFLLPSRKEGMPYVILEAGASGIPVIGSNVGGIPEIIENRISGFLINPKEPNTIGVALRELMDNEMLRHSLGYMLQTHIAEKFTLSEMLKETQAIYLKLK